MGGNDRLGARRWRTKLFNERRLGCSMQSTETDFLGFSYGFRPGRSQHDALDALYRGINERKVNWVQNVDVRSSFDRLSHHWLVKFLQRRTADPLVPRLLQ